MSLHVKKINRQFSVLKKPELSGFFHALISLHCWMAFQLTTKIGDCPVMSGFFHSPKRKHFPKCPCKWNYVIARLCRAFFMHSVVVMTLSWHFWTQLMIARYVGLFSCTPREWMYYLPTLEKQCDCPVMSGFFHARRTFRNRQRNTRIQMYGDCPVMSGFFHAQLY